MIKPKVVSDIKSYLLFENKNSDNIYCIGSLSIDKYIEVKESNKNAILLAISYFNGINTLEQIEEKIKVKNLFKLDVYELCTKLTNAGLIENPVNENESQKNELDRMGINIATFNLKNPHNILVKIASLQNVYIILGLIIILGSIPFLPGVIKDLMFINIYSTFNSSIISLLISLAITTLSVILHEMSHAVTATSYGLIPKRLKITLYLYINPLAYIEIPGIYTLDRKKRTYIWSAGIFCNLLIFSAAAILQSFFYGSARKILLVTCFSNLGLIVTNLIPFLPLDGYFLLSTLLKIPNLRKKTLNGITNSVKNKNVRIKIVYVSYYILSILTLGYLVLSQLSQITYNFYVGFSSNKNLWDGLMEIKIYLLYIIIIVITRIKSRIKKGANKNGH